MSSLDIIILQWNWKMSMEEFYEYKMNVATTMILTRYDYYGCYDYMSYHYHITAIIMMIWSVIWASVFLYVWIFNK